MTDQRVTASGIAARWQGHRADMRQQEEKRAAVTGLNAVISAELCRMAAECAARGACVGLPPGLIEARDELLYGGVRGGGMAG